MKFEPFRDHMKKEPSVLHREPSPNPLLVIQDEINETTARPVLAPGGWRRSLRFEKRTEDKKNEKLRRPSRNKLVTLTTCQ